MQQITDDFYVYTHGKIASGQFGTVFKGWSESRKIKVAIKKLDMKKITPTSERQILILKDLSTLNRTNIMKYYGDFKDHNGQIYLFLEFCPFDLKSAILFGRKQSQLQKINEQNSKLSEIQIKKLKLKDKTIQKTLGGKILTELQILRFFKQMLEGMGQIHAKNQIHRDLKPQNILISEDCNLKICDFGLARQNLNIFETGRNGTPIYSAPEVVLEIQYDKNCEVWNAGLILYEMLTGKMFFHGVSDLQMLKQSWNHVKIGLKYASYGEKGFHPLWEYFTNSMLTFDHHKRPSFNDILKTLKLVYDKMQREIKNKKLEESENPNVRNLERFLDFEVKKSKILRQAFSEMIKIKSSVQISEATRFMIMFLCHSKYLKHMNDLVGKLCNRRIKLPNEQERIEIQNMKKDSDLFFCMQKYRRKIQIKCTYQCHELKGYVVGGLKKLFKEKFPLDLRALDEKIQLDFFQEVNFVSDGHLSHEDTYTKNLQLIVSKCIPFDKQSLQTVNQQSLKAIFWVMLAARLDDEFPVSLYKEQNYVEKHIGLQNTKFQKNPLFYISQMSKKFI